MVPRGADVETSTIVTRTLAGGGKRMDEVKNQRVKPGVRQRVTRLI
jgi:hypothetical protein